MKNSFATGNRIYLKPASLSDAKGNWYKWLNDRETTKYLVNQFWPNTKELQIQFIKNSIENKDRLIEIASMLGGKKPGKAAMDNAAELLN